MTIRDEYDLPAIPVDGEREQYDATGEPEESREQAPRYVDTWSKAVVEEVARNDHRFGRYEDGMDAPGSPYWGHVSNGPGTYEDIKEACREELADVERVRLRMDTVDERVEPYQGDRAIVVVDDSYQVIIHEPTQDVVAVRGWENIAVRPDGTVRDSGFRTVCQALDDCAAVEDYLDDVGVTVDGINDGEGSFLNKKPWSGW